MCVHTALLGAGRGCCAVVPAPMRAVSSTPRLRCRPRGGGPAPRPRRGGNAGGESARRAPAKPGALGELGELGELPGSQGTAPPEEGAAGAARAEMDGAVATLERGVNGAIVNSVSWALERLYPADTQPAEALGEERGAHFAPLPRRPAPPPAPPHPTVAKFPAYLHTQPRGGRKGRACGPRQSREAFPTCTTSASALLWSAGTSKAPWHPPRCARGRAVSRAGGDHKRNMSVESA